MEVRVGPAVITIHVDDEVLVSEPNGQLSSDAQEGYFIADTRLVSGYRLRIGRCAPILLNSSQVAGHSARFEFTNPELRDDVGTEIGAHSLHLRLDRSLGRGLHEDYDLTNYSGKTLVAVVEVSIESDFADIFDVKDEHLQRRGTITSLWDPDTATLANDFVHEGFKRGIRIEATGVERLPTYANGGLLFPLELAPGQTWHTCLRWRPVLDDGQALPTIKPCHDLLDASDAKRGRDRFVPGTTSVTTSDPEITAIIRQAVDDLVGLRMRTAGTDDRDRFWVPAAGVPWFVSLFGRDALVTSLQALPATYKFAAGSLRALADLQATGTDDDRDMQPGKIEHELRRGELASLRLIPHTPYYGSHDATALFVLTAATMWRWQGDKTEVSRLRPHVEAALAWMDRDGDLDGDGLQEYRTLSRRGYFNQGWKDAHDAILHADGTMPELPIATCEMQGLAVAAKREWAGVLESCFGERTAARRLEEEARRLSGQIEERFWWDSEGTYYLALDGKKQPVESVASNAGQLLYFEAIDPDRARQVAERLFRSDVWSGWGIRTLSESHPSYNPFSYQLGSVWPHDNVLIARGLRRYGLDAEAQAVARGMFDAAACLVNRRLPELFSGLGRDEVAFPVQYLGANVPQAWASGAIVQLLDVLLGLAPDAASGTLRVNPALPEWLDEVRLDGLAIGETRVSFSVSRTSQGHRLAGPSCEPSEVTADEASEIRISLD